MQHLILLKILNMTDINAELPQLFTIFLLKSLQAVVLICMQVNLLFNNEKLAEELHKPIIKKLKKEQFILHSKTIFWVLI